MAIELYRITTARREWRFCTGKLSRAMAGNVYTPASIKRGKIQHSDQAAKNDLEFTTGRDNPFVQFYLVDRLRSTASVTVFAATGEVAWRGRVVSVSLEGHTAKIVCESIFTSLSWPGLRAMYQTICRHSLYFSGCNVDRALHMVAGEITQVSGSTLTIPVAATAPDGYYKGGFLIWDEQTDMMIMEHTGTQVRVERSFPNAGPVELYPGCDLLIEDCKNKFVNVKNYGGFPWIPETSPFTGII